MNKRDFLKNALAIAGALAVPVASVKAEPRPMMPKQREYLGYTYFWTGLKASHENSWKVGQWLAWPLRGFGHADVVDREPYLYVSIPGCIGGPYIAGSVFNITNRNRIITYETPDWMVEMWVDEGERYIRQLIEAYHGHPSDSLYFHGGHAFPCQIAASVR